MTRTQPEPTPKHYITQLDGLRALALGAVIFEHFLPPDKRPWGSIPLGSMALDMFFVLSGFLVTAILLRCRDKLRAPGQALGHTLRSFYVRRALRIFPAFYLLVIVGVALGLPPFRETVGWLFTHTYNIFRSFHQGHEGHAYHMWSLAQQEQFYLVWPLIILLVPKRYLTKVIAFFVLLGPASRLLLLMLGLGDGNENVAIRFFPTANLETFALGALLALVRHREMDAPEKPQQIKMMWVTGLLGLIGCGFMGTMLALRLAERSAMRLLLPTVDALLATALLAFVALGIKGTLGKLLDARPMRYLGKISFGIYLYHVVLIEILTLMEAHYGLPLPANEALRAIVFTLASVALAALSWHALEEPVNGLKRFFPYCKPAVGLPADPRGWRVADHERARGLEILDAAPRQLPSGDLGGVDAGLLDAAPGAGRPG